MPKKVSGSAAAQPIIESATLMEFSQAAYGELRRIAGMLFKSEQPWRTLQPTALVHETFVRLAESGPDHYVNRAQFFGIAARTMRRILVEEARRRGAGKRGDGWERVSFEDLQVASLEHPDYISIDSWLTRLSRTDRRLAQLVELRVFAGMTSQEIADLLGMGESTVRRDWHVAKALLRKEMSSGSDC